MRKRTALLLMFILIAASFSAYSIFSALILPSAPSVTEVRLRFYDYSTGEAIEGLAVNFNITTGRRNVFTIAGVSDEHGRIIQTLPTNDIVLPVSAKNISISGSWVLEKATGEETLSVAEQKWSVINPKAFRSNSSEYIFDGVHFSHEQNGPALNLGLDFYLTSGRLVAIYNPIPEVRYLDWRLRVNLLDSNFVEFAGVDYAAVPIGRPLILDLEVDYYTSRFMINVSVDVGNRSFIDLTSSFIRSVSSAQIEELKRSLDNLKPYGFELTAQYDKISQMAALYDLAIIEAEHQDYESFRTHFRSAANSYRDLHMEIAGIYTSGLWWIPSLLMIFLFFSFSLSRLVTNRKMHSIFLLVFLFSAVFFLFLPTHPYLMIFISNPLVLLQSFTMPTVLLIMVQVLPIIVITISMFFSNMKSFIFETFEVSIRNLRRRKLKTVLALFTILAISASAMSFLTITTEKKPTSQVPYPRVSPTVDRGLTIYKIRVQNTKDGSITYRLPIQQYEVRLFSTHEWLEAMNVYGVMKVRFARVDGFTIEDFSTFNLVVVNASFMRQYHNVSDVLGIEWFEDADTNSVIIGSKIAEAYDLGIGSEVLINDNRFTVKSIVDEETAVEKLKDIDGDLFLFMVFDPTNKRIERESFIFGTLSDFERYGFTIYRVSIVLKSEYTQNATQIARDIQDLAYDFGTTKDFSYVVTYSVHAISSNSVFIVYSSSPKVTILGQWQTQIVPIIITTMVLVANTMGTVAERKSEVRTISTLGANPLRIGLIFVTEGLVLGIVGGIFGYVFGYLLVQYADIALPTLVQENIIGGAPFTIAVTTATLASLAGCLLPARNAIRIAVPSGRLGQRTKDIMKIQAGKAHLEIPLKIERNKKDLFETFLKELADEYSYMKYWFIHINRSRVEETEEGTLYEMTVNYTAAETANFLVSILVKPKENLRVTIQPIEDVKTRRICRWNRGHKNNIHKLCSILRQDLLEFTELERKVTESAKSNHFT